MDVLFASLPILMVIVAMLVFLLPAKTALPLGWFATFAVAIGNAAASFMIVCAVLVIMCRMFGPEFASLVGAIPTLAITVFFAKKGWLCPKTVWDFERREVWDSSWLSTVPVKADVQGRMSPILAWMPYVLIAALLVAARLDWFGLKGLLTSSFLTIRIPHVCGCEQVGWQWNWGWNPGVMPFVLVCAITFVLHRMSPGKIKESVVDTFVQIKGAAIAIAFGVSMVYLYRNTGCNAALTSKSMVYVMAESLAGTFSKAYVGIAPRPGWGRRGSNYPSQHPALSCLLSDRRLRAGLSRLRPVGDMV